MIVQCKQCQHEYPVDDSCMNEDLFITVACPNCATKCNKCLLCNQCYSISSSKNDYRRIKLHVSTSHQTREIIAQEPNDKKEESNEGQVAEEDVCFNLLEDSIPLDHQSLLSGGKTSYNKTSMYLVMHHQMCTFGRSTHVGRIARKNMVG